VFLEFDTLAIGALTNIADFASFATARFEELIEAIAKKDQAKGKTLGPLSHQSF